MSLKLIIGLCNPGQTYDNTRHNAGAWFIHALLQKHGAQLKEDKKLQSLLTSITLHDLPCLLATPTSYMNISGLGVQLLSRYYKIEPSSLLIVHDDLDLPAGSIKLKADGGHGGHNGLKDIIQHLGTPHFYRLRIGIGHPRQREAVEHYVLHPPSKEDKLRIDEMIQEGIDILPYAMQGEWSKAMQLLHTANPTHTEET